MLQLNFTPFPQLITERLTLRQLEVSDENEIYVLRSDEEVNRYLDRSRATTLEDAQQFIKKINQNISNNESIYWAITFKGDFKLIGTICYWNISKENFRAEIGYELLPQFQRQGVMQEALSRILEFGFEEMKLQTIEAYPHVHNDQSIKLLIRNNFIRDFEAEDKNKNKEEFRNTVIYRLTSKVNWKPAA